MPPCPSKTIPPDAWGAAYFPDAVEFAWQAGRAMIAQSDFAAARCFFELPHDSVGEQSQYWLDRGDASWGLGNAAEAVADWEHAGKDSLAAASRLRAGYEHTGAWDKADRVCEILKREHPNDVENRYRCALTAVIHSPADALPALDQAAAAPSPDSASAANLASVIRDSLRVGDTAFLFARIGEVLVSYGEPWLAEAVLRRSILSLPDYGDAHALLGLALENEGKDGEMEYRLGAQLAPNSSTACLFFGSWLRRNHQSDLARVWLERAWRITPDDSAIAAELAALDFAAGNIASAEDILLQAVHSHPTDASAWLALADFYIRNEIRVEQSGIPAARQAVLLAPQNPNALEVLGRAYYLLGDFAEAESFYRRALALAPQSASLHANLGLTLQQNGDLAGAIAELNQAMRLEPNGEAGKQAQAALDQIRASS
jgi:Flp pilus assembly protein TadD